MCAWALAHPNLTTANNIDQLDLETDWYVHQENPIKKTYLPLLAY
jgi:hypothetical protein